MGELNSEGECPPACLNGGASDGAKTVEQRWGMLIVFTQYLRRLELEITISEFKAKLIFKNYSNSSDENSSNESGLAYRKKIRSVLRKCVCVCVCVCVCMCVCVCVCACVCVCMCV